MGKCIGCENNTLLTAFIGRQALNKIRYVCIDCLPGHTTILPYSNCRCTRPYDDGCQWITELYLSLGNWR